MPARSLLLLLLYKADADAGAPVEVADADAGAPHPKKNAGAPHPWPLPTKEVQGWPIFKDKKSLEANGWGKYYKEVYGAVPDTYPVNPADLWILFNDKLEHAKVTHIPKSVGMCPSGKAGDHYDLNNAMQPKGTSYVWHAYPYKGIPSHTKVEVSHKLSTHGDSSVGAWMMYAPGSGIYFDIGKTKVFEQHADAMKHFGVTEKDWHKQNPILCANAGKKGYDTIQFLAHADPQYICSPNNEYGKKKKLQFKYMGLEIISTKLYGVHNCMAKDSTPKQLSVGWGGKYPCKCDHKQTFLNCGGKAEMALNETGEVIV